MPYKDPQKRKEYIRKYMRERYRNDPEFRERMIKANRLYSVMNREKVNEKNRKWVKQNPNYHPEYRKRIREDK